MSLAKRLKEARQNAGLSQKELAESLNMNLRTYGSYERGERDISTAVLKDICKTLKISSDYLLGRDTPVVESNATMLPDSNVRMIPVYESVAAGFGAHAENVVVDYMPLYIVSSAEAENTLIIRVEGNSMYPKIEDGDSIQVLRQDFAENGQVAVLLIDGEDAVVKQFFHDPKAKRVTLHSLNPDYMDRVFEGIEITKLRVLGVVKRVIKDI
jgi:repressor LexA